MPLKPWLNKDKVTEAQIPQHKFPPVSFYSNVNTLHFSNTHFHLATSTQLKSTSSPAAVIEGTKACLSVCKDGGVVALEAALDQLLGAGGVDGVLLGVHVKHIVVGEGLVFAQDHLRLPGHHVCTDVTSLYLLSGQLRTNPAENEKKIKVLQQLI